MTRHHPSDRPRPDDDGTDTPDEDTAIPDGDRDPRDDAPAPRARPDGGTATGSTTDTPDRAITPETEVVYQATPTIRPVLVWFALTLVVGGGFLGYLLARPELLGERQLTDIVFWVVFLLVAATLLRFAVKMFILTRTRYMVTTDDIRREYELVYRRHAREIPIEKVRGMEFEQGRIQSLLGFGTLSFLAGGTNQSLGFVEFEHLPQPHSARDTIRDTIARRVE